MKRQLVPLDQLSSESQNLFRVLRNESDLGIVAIAAAFLDESIASILAHHFQKTASVATKLLGERGALSTFSARCDLAYCLNLVNKPDYQDLNTIGAIRNLFAHSRLSMSFLDHQVVDLCDCLVGLEVRMGREFIVTATEEERAEAARDLFRMTVTVLTSELMMPARERLESMSRSRLAPKDAI